MVDRWSTRSHVWEQIADVIRGRIRSGVYPLETVLSEVKLEAEFEVARGTIRRAMRALREEGLVETLSGKGSIVISKGDILD